MKSKQQAPQFVNVYLKIVFECMTCILTSLLKQTFCSVLCRIWIWILKSVSCLMRLSGAFVIVTGTQKWSTNILVIIIHNIADQHASPLKCPACKHRGCAMCFGNRIEPLWGYVVTKVLGNGDKPLSELLLLGKTLGQWQGWANTLNVTGLAKWVWKMNNTIVKQYVVSSDRTKFVPTSKKPVWNPDMLKWVVNPDFKLMLSLIWLSRCIFKWK